MRTCYEVDFDTISRQKFMIFHLEKSPDGCFPFETRVRETKWRIAQNKLIHLHNKSNKKRGNFGDIFFYFLELLNCLSLQADFRCL